MKAHSGTSPRALLQLWLARFGAGWPLALAVALAAGALHLGALAPTRVAVADAKERLAQAKRAPAALAAPLPPRSDTQQLQAARALLPPAVDATRQIGALDALARAQQIALTRADYSERAHADIGLVQLQVMQPIKAGYPQVKRYIETVLRTMPNASLDQVVARRDNVAQSQLEVRLRWSMWLRSPAPGESRP